MRQACVAPMVAVMAMTAAVPAPAGEVARTMAALEERLDPGTEVDVVDREGRMFRGEIVQTSADGVLLSVDGAGEGRRIAAADITTVTRQGDSLKNGLLIGGGIGLLLGVLVNTADPDPALGGDEWCEGSDCFAFAAVSALTYAGIGALVDHLVKGREVVYRAPTARVSLSVAPQLVRGGVGARVALAF